MSHHCIAPGMRTCIAPEMIVSTLCVGMPQRRLCVRIWDAERPGLHSHAEHGNDQKKRHSRVPFFHAAANTLVVGVFFLRVVSHVTNALELGNTLEQLSLIHI